MGTQYKYINKKFFDVDEIVYFNSEKLAAYRPLKIGNNANVNIVVKNILEIDGSIPSSFLKLDSDIPNFIVTQSTIFQLVPLDYVHPLRKLPANYPVLSQQKQLDFMDSILIYCFARPGENYNTNLTYNLKNKLSKLLNILKQYYIAKLCTVKIQEFYNDYEYYTYNPDDEASGDLILDNEGYTSNTKYVQTYTLRTIKAWDPPSNQPPKEIVFDEEYLKKIKNETLYKDIVAKYGKSFSLSSDDWKKIYRVENVRQLVSLRTIAKTLNYIAYKMGIPASNIYINSSYRSQKYNSYIYLKDHLMPNMASKHMLAQAVDFVVANHILTLNAIAREIVKVVPFADKIIREADTYKDLTASYGWIHLQINPNAVYEVLENKDFFWQVVNSTNTNYPASDIAYIPLDSELRSGFVSEVRGSLSAQLQRITPAIRKNVAFIYLVKTNRDNKKGVYKPSEIYGGIMPSEEPIKESGEVLARAQNITDTVTYVESIKSQSYTWPGVKYYYNFDKDAWELVGSSSLKPIQGAQEIEVEPETTTES
jgi:hypothetical protein